MPNPTIVIIQGAATTAEHYASLRQKFEAKGYPVISQDPPSITAEDATIVTIDVDIGFVRDAVLGPLLAESKDIVLICHSYGGSYGAGAVRGLSKKERTAKGEQGGVIGIIYIASFCTEPGESALQTLGIGDEIPVWVGPGEKPGTLIFTDASQIWPSLPSDEAAEWLGKMKPVAVAAVGTPVSYAPFKDPNYDDAIAYVWAEEDAIITPKLREAYLAKSGITLTRSIKGGHGIDLEGTDEVVKNVIELVEHFREK